MSELIMTPERERERGPWLGEGAEEVPGGLGVDGGLAPRNRCAGSYVCEITKKMLVKYLYIFF